MMILFGDHITLLEPEVQYHGDIANAAGLKWVLGFGHTTDFNAARFGLALRYAF